MDSVGDGEGGEIWENGIETCIISCIKREKKKKKHLSNYFRINISLFCPVDHYIAQQPG